MAVRSKTTHLKARDKVRHKAALPVELPRQCELLEEEEKEEENALCVTQSASSTDGTKVTNALQGGISCFGDSWTIGALRRPSATGAQRLLCVRRVRCQSDDEGHKQLKNAWRTDTV